MRRSSLSYSIDLFLFRFTSLCTVKLYVYKWHGFMTVFIYLNLLRVNLCTFASQFLYLVSSTTSPSLLIINEDFINLETIRHNWPCLISKWQHVVTWIINEDFFNVKNECNNWIPRPAIRCPVNFHVSVILFN